VGSLQEHCSNGVIFEQEAAALTVPHTRQAELVDHLLDHNLTEEEIRTVKDSLMIDLSPVSYRRSST